MGMHADAVKRTEPRHAGRDDDAALLAFPRAERRHQPRGTAEGEPERRSLVSMVVRTYRELPGLMLHVGQAARLFGLRRTTCQIVLDDLVRTRHLRRTTDGQYTSI